MSRTDVHRPYHVQQADPHERHRWYRFQTWSTEPPVLVPVYRTCNCTVRGCSNREWRRAERRKARHGWREQLRRGRL